MSQISPPIRILLVCAVGFLGAYMLFLRPKDESVPPASSAPNTQTSEPAVTSPGKAVESAQKAVDATNDKLSAEQSVDGVDAGETNATTKAGSKTTPSQAPEAAAAAAGVDLKGLPKPVAKAIRRHKVLVLLFWNGKSADDKAVHKALADVNRWHGRVAVESVAIKKISRYGRIARGVDVEQSPTVVVADSELRAETLVGYVDTETIDQAVVDALRATGPLFTDAYLRKVDAVCVQHSNKMAAIPNYYGGDSVKEVDARLSTYDGAVRDFRSDWAALRTPKKWRAYESRARKDVATIASEITTFAAAVTPRSSVREVLAAQTRYYGAIKPASKRLNRTFASQGLIRCGADF